MPTSDELVVAGTSGIGAVFKDEDSGRLAERMRRARRTPAPCPYSSTNRRRLSSTAARSSWILTDWQPPRRRARSSKLSRRPARLRSIGGRAGFLVLDRDPRLEPGRTSIRMPSSSDRRSFFDPSDWWLRPRPFGHALPPPKPVQGDGWVSYELVIDGLLRGGMVGDRIRTVWSSRGRRRSQTAHPVDERLQASVEWPPVGRCSRWSAMGAPFRLPPPDPDSEGARLGVEFRGEPIEEVRSSSGRPAFLPRPARSHRQSCRSRVWRFDFDGGSRRMSS